MPRNKDIFYSGDIIEVTGTNVKRTFRGHRGRINRWIHDSGNIYLVSVFMNTSEIELVLRGCEMKLITDVLDTLPVQL